MTDELEVRPLNGPEWDVAMAVTARAFLHEPFVIGLLGAEPVARYARCRARYASIPFDPDGDCLGAFVGDDLVGAIGVERAGHCHHCLKADEPDFITGAISTYQRNATASHARQPAHGWVGRVAIEPALHGAGVGSRLLAEALAHLARRGTEVALLDCETHRVGFYARRGFVALDSFRGSVDNELVLMSAPTASASS